PGLFKRVERANALKPDLFLSVHHDAAPDKFMQSWKVDGKQQKYCDRFSGHSVFVSNESSHQKENRAFAHQLGMALKHRGLAYATQYTQKFMGNRQRVLLDREAGVYEFNHLVVLMETKMPAALLEAGSIVNRDEELKLATPARQKLIGSAVVEAVDAFC